MTLDPVTADQLPDRLPADDPRAPLGFRSQLRQDLQAAEDATAANDHERAHAAGPRFTRPSTEAERVLLEALGWTDSQGHPPGPSTTTRIQFLGGIRMRAWPTLTAPAPAEDTTTTITETEAPR